MSAPDAHAGARPDLRQLTGVRFIAAIWVVLYHFQFMIYGLVPELRAVSFLFDSGYLAVDLFFVLSGYIIAYQYLGEFAGGRGPYRRFLIRRIARIYPVQLCTVILAIMTILSGLLIGVPIPASGNFTVWGAIQDLLLIRGWEPFPEQGWNFPAWSLSAEWFAYLLFPLVALAIGAARRRRGALLAVVGGCLMLEGLGAWLLPSFNGMPHPLVRVVAGFVAGAAIFAIGPPRRIPREALAIVGLVGLTVLIVVAGLVTVDPARAVVALALASVIVIGLAGGGGAPLRWLQSRPFEYGGRISYGIYMIHGLVLMAFGVWLVALGRAVPRAEFLQWALIARVGMLLIPFAVVLVLGIGLYHLIERPGQRRISRLAERLTSPAPAPAPATPTAPAPERRPNS